MALTEPRELGLPPHHAANHSCGCQKTNPEESSHSFSDMKTGYWHTLFYCVLLYCASQVLQFYKLKEIPSTSKKKL